MILSSNKLLDVLGQGAIQLSSDQVKEWQLRGASRVLISQRKFRGV
jgi:hypothetical protein